MPPPVLFCPPVLPSQILSPAVERDPEDAGLDAVADGPRGLHLHPRAAVVRLGGLEQPGGSKGRILGGWTVAIHTKDYS